MAQSIRQGTPSRRAVYRVPHTPPWRPGFFAFRETVGASASTITDRQELGFSPEDSPVKFCSQL